MLIAETEGNDKMKNNGITLASSPQDGSVAITYDELEASNAKRFVALYIDADAPEYDGDLDGEELPEDILAAAIALNRSLQVLHFVPERSVQWLIDNVEGVYDETVRSYAELELGMERVKNPIAAARAQMTARRAAAGQLGKDAQLEMAMAGATTDEVINALFASFDGDDVVQIIGGLTAMMDHMQEVAAEKARAA
jgi:hypothetical protein